MWHWDSAAAVTKRHRLHAEHPLVELDGPVDVSHGQHQVI